MCSVVIVTGASRGVGRAVALELAREGVKLGLTARDGEALHALVAEGNLDAVVVPGDIASPETSRRLVEEVLQRFQRLDGLVNNAGVLAPIATVARADIRAWYRALEVNIGGVMAMIQRALPSLRSSHGRIVNVSSGAAYKVIEGWSAYCVSKAGLNHLTRILAAEEPDVTALSLRPGIVDTAMQDLIRAEGDGGMTPEMVAYFRDLHSRGELLPPEVPARATAWLVLHAPPQWSGEFLQYDDSRIGEGGEVKP